MTRNELLNCQNSFRNEAGVCGTKRGEK